MLPKRNKNYEITYSFSDNKNANTFDNVVNNLLKKFLIEYEK